MATTITKQGTSIPPPPGWIAGGWPSTERPSCQICDKLDVSWLTEEVFAEVNICGFFALADAGVGNDDRDNFFSFSCNFRGKNDQNNR